MGRYARLPPRFFSHTVAVHPLPTHLYRTAFAKVSANEYVG